MLSREHLSPSREQVTERRWVAVAVTLAALVLYSSIIVVCQRVQDAPRAAFGAYPDESSHYVSGLLVRDYLVSGLASSPIRYAVDYYTHVPYFAVGYWPPVFYGVEAVWMICFGSDRASVLGLVALIAGLGATLIFSALRSSAGTAPAFGAGLLFLFAPVVQWSSVLVMTDLLVTFLSFAAAIIYARYLDSERMGTAVVFAILAALTILTKGSGIFLALLPPAAVLVSGRFYLLKRISFWIVPVVVAILYAPWFLLSRNLMSRGFEGYQKPSLPSTLFELGAGLGENLVWLVPLVALGVWKVLRGPRPLPGLAVICMVEPVLVVAFIVVAPVGSESRYLIPALPPLIVLAAYGAQAVGASITPRHASLAAAATVFLFAAGFGVRAVSRFHRAGPNGMRPIAEFVIGKSAPGYHSVLVSTDAEGPMIAEISQREAHRLSRFLVRPNKLLARIGWTGTDYQCVYKTKEEMQALFDKIPFDLVIIRTNPPSTAMTHELLLRDAVLAFPDRWRLVYSTSGDGGAAERYAAYEPVKLHEISQEALAQFLGDLLDRHLRAIH